MLLVRIDYFSYYMPLRCWDPAPTKKIDLPGDHNYCKHSPKVLGEAGLAVVDSSAL